MAVAIETMVASNSETDTRAAYVGIVAALVGTVVGAVIAGAFAFAVTTTQLDRQERQSRTDFLRAERQTAYANLLEQMHAVYHVQTTEYFALDSAAEPYSQQQLNAAHARLSAARGSYEKAWSVVSLLGSPEVLPVAVEVEVSVSEALNAFAGDGRTGRSGNGGVKDELEKAIGEQPSQWQRFVEAARKDLEAG